MNNNQNSIPPSPRPSVPKSLRLSAPPSPSPSVSPSRRAFLGSSSALIALPLLESFTKCSFAGSVPVRAQAAPKRMVFIGIGYGVTEDEWYPDQKTVGKDYEFPNALKPLESYRDDITIIQNLEHQYSKDGHSGSTFWLTGANRYAVAGQSFHNTVSVDQVAAEQLGQETRFTSIQLAAKGPNGSGDGHGPGLSLAWNRHGKPVAALNTPVAAFHRLFSNDTMPLDKRQEMLRQQRSVLDTVLSDARSVNNVINKNDKDKLDEYFQSVREIEIRLAKEESWLTVPKKVPNPPVKEPRDSLSGVQEIKIMYELMVAAMQVDATRVFSYRLPVNTMIASLGAEMSAHSMSHYTEGERRDVSRSRDQAHAKLMGEFIDKLKASKEPDGSSLYDNVAIAFGGNLRSIHSLSNCPTLLTGGGAGFKHGRHLVADRKTPLCNLWLSMLNGSGVNVDSHGDSTGRIDELFSA